MVPTAMLPLLFLASPIVSHAAALVHDDRHTAALPDTLSTATTASSNIPLLVWHGLGDASDSDGLQNVGRLYRELYPGSIVYYISLGADGGADRHASWFGNLKDQISQVCDDLGEAPELKGVEAVNAIGFSQGGQFLRGLVETCNRPPVRSLVTFGSQHNGIARYQACKAGDWLCTWLNGIARSNTWGSWTQSNVVPAQYFRDPEDLGNYLENSAWLADINNERSAKTRDYIVNMESLQRFAMYVFANDSVVHPRESGWFGEYNETSGQATRLQDRQLYHEDWLGLRTLDSEGALAFEQVPGEHMHLNDEDIKDAFRRHMARDLKKKPPHKSGKNKEEGLLGHIENDHDAL